MGKVYNCDICKKVSYRSDYYKGHVARIHPQDESVKMTLFKCDYCESYFKSIKNRSHHLASYCRQLPIISSKAEGEVVKRSLLDVALEQSEINLNQLSPPQNRDAAIGIESVQESESTQSNKVDFKKSLLDLALEQSEINFNERDPALEKNEAIRISANGSDKILIDSTNSNEFLNPKEARIEKLLDMGRLKITKGYKTRYFHCPICDTGIRRLPRLIKHIQDMHPVTKTFEFQCPICNKSFRHQYQLKIHAKEAHKINCLQIRNRDLDEYLRCYQTGTRKSDFMKNKYGIKQASSITPKSKRKPKLEKSGNANMKKNRVPDKIDKSFQSHDSVLNQPTSCADIDNRVNFNFDDIAENYMVLSATPQHEDILASEEFNFHKGKSMPTLNSPFNNNECENVNKDKNIGDQGKYQDEDTTIVNYFNNSISLKSKPPSNNIKINSGSASPTNFITLHSAKKKLSLNVELHPNKLRSCVVPNIGKFEVLGSPMENLLKEYSAKTSAHVENYSLDEGKHQLKIPNERDTGEVDINIAKNGDSDEDSLLPDDVSLASVDESDVASVDIEISALFRNHNSGSRCSNTQSKIDKCSPCLKGELPGVTNNEYGANSLIHEVDVHNETTPEMSNIAENEFYANDLGTTEDTADILNTTQQVVDIVFDLETDSEKVTIDNSNTSEIHSNLNLTSNPVNEAINGIYLLGADRNMVAIENSYTDSNSNCYAKEMTTENEIDESNYPSKNDFREQEALDTLSLVSFSEFPLTNHDPNISIEDVDLDNICENQEATFNEVSTLQTDSNNFQLQQYTGKSSDVLKNAIPEFPIKASISSLEPGTENIIFKRPNLPRIQILSNISIKKPSSNIIETSLQPCEDVTTTKARQLHVISKERFQMNDTRKLKKKICRNMKYCHQSKLRLLLRKHGLLLQYRCVFCSKLFTTPSSLRNHILIHNEHEALICYVCGLQTLSKQNMRAHIFNKHLFVDGIKLGKMPKNPPRSFDFNKHLKTLYCYECTLCKLKFHKQADALAHLDSDECQKHIYYKCEICGQCLGNKQSFNRHRRQLHGAPAKKRSEELLLSEIYGKNSLINELKPDIEHRIENQIDNKIEEDYSEAKKNTASIENICDNLIDQNNFDVDEFFVKPLPSKLASPNATYEVAQTKVDEHRITPDMFSLSKILCSKNTNTDKTLNDINTIINNNNISKHTEHRNEKNAVKIQRELSEKDESTVGTNKMPLDKYSEVSLKVQQSPKSCQESFEKFLKSKQLCNSFTTKSYKPSTQKNIDVIKSTNANSSSSEVRTPDLVNFNEGSSKQDKHVETMSAEETTDVAMTTLAINDVLQKEFPNETEELPDLDDILAKAVTMKNIRYKTKNFEFKCNHCYANFRSKMALWSHTKHKHKNKQHYKCAECAKTFEYNRSLKDHMKFKHSELNTTKCDICCKKLHISSYKNHMRVHSNEKRYSCPVCAIKFKQPSSRKLHFIKAHVEGQLGKGEDTDLKSMLETFSEDIYC